MTQSKELRNVNISSVSILPTPDVIKNRIPSNDQANATVEKGRTAIQDILDGKDDRIFVVIGPCSIHDSKAAFDYAQRLNSLSQEIRDTMAIVMRVYFEKPRTSVGWKGFINDPFLDDSFRMEEGLERARTLLIKINEIGLPVGTEALDPITPQYLDELISWYAIGARTVESQTHREMASGLSSAVGFKNGTDGNIQVAINALKSVQQSHRFLGINQEGQCSIFETAGNPFGHTVLRGGGGRSNFDAVSVSLCEQGLESAGLPKRIMVDCSHGNSNKDPKLQPLVFKNCIQQIVDGNTSIKGLMVESNLEWGAQDLGPDLKYGVSITDACIDWNTTEEMLLQAHQELLKAKANQ
ncbi:MAG: 3-deoxy-7-phosphoheptulonate synthase [Bdellovibrionales bacterium]|nr:3-deoxy-7-phosphoheptulonate synthase [Bdellovibrionales bacterium]